MNSPCLPAARAEPATATSAVAIPNAASFRKRSEVSGKLHTAWTNHRSAAREPGEVSRRRAGVSFGRAASNREVQNGAQHQARAADCERDGGDIAFELGRVDVAAAIGRASVALALPFEVLLALHGEHAEHGAHADADRTRRP